MGVCYSCFNRKRRQRGDEREPLLPKYAPVVPPQSQFDKISDIVAALSTGKYPSQDQINNGLRLLINSDALKTENGAVGGPLSKEGHRVLEDVRGILHALIKLGMQKNADDTVQDLLWQASHMEDVPVKMNMDMDVSTNMDVKIALEEGVSKLDDTPGLAEISDDFRKMTSSMWTLLSLLVTSSAFRLILSDILVTSRDILADVAVDVAKVAAAVELRAGQVEDIIRPADSELPDESPSLDSLAQEGQKVQEQAAEATRTVIDETREKQNDIWEKLQDESPDRIKGTVLQRIAQIIEQAQSSPKYTAALITMATLFRKYIEQLASTAETLGNVAQASTSQAPASVKVDPVVDTDPHLNRAIDDLKTLVERFSGRQISPLGDKFIALLRDISSEETKGDDGLPAFIEAATRWLNRSLLQLGWMNTEEGKREGSELYDRLFELLNRDPRYKADARGVLEEIFALKDALVADQATSQVYTSIQTLFADLSKMGRVGIQLATTESRKQWQAAKAELWRDVMGWLLPRVLRALRTIPLPRVELKSDTVDLVVDKVTLSSPSFIPDNIQITNYTDFLLRASEAATDRYFSTSTSTQTKVLVNGLRLSIEDIAYYVNAKGPLYTGWLDNGLLTVDIGGKRIEGDGVSLVLNIEVPSQEEREPNGDVFRVLDVKVDVPGLAFSMDQTRHWILNGIMQPFLGPLVRTGVAFFLSSQIKGGLEGLNSYLCQLRAKAKLLRGDEQSLEFADYWNALMQADTTPMAVEISTAPSTPTEELQTHATIEATTKGIIRTAVTENAEGEQQSETVLAIGIGEQILPGLGGPEPETQPTLVDQGREALNELDDARKGVEEEVFRAKNEAVDANEVVRERIANAGERMKVKKAKYARSPDWRSDAFSL